MKIVAAENPRQLGSLVRALVLAKGSRMQAIEIANNLGMPHNVVAALKAVIGAGTTVNPTFAGDLGADGAITRSFIDQLKSRSIFYSLTAGNLLRRVPLRTPIMASTAEATGWIVGEGKPIPVTSIAVERQSVHPISAAALLVITDELLRAAGSDGDSFVIRLLRDAVAKAVDAQFLNIIRPSGSHEFVASGPTVDAMRYDLLRLLNSIVKTGSEAVLFGAAPDVVNALATYSDVWAGVTPNGGRLLGTPLISSDALSPGEMVLVDGGGIVGNDGLIEIDASDQSSIETLDSALTQDSGTGEGASSLVSMWQTKSVAIRALSTFGAECIAGRNAIATLSGITLGSHEST